MCRAEASSLAETAALDQLIDLLLAARSDEELTKLVTDNIFSMNQKFWLRVATRSDTAGSTAEKQRLSDLAAKAMRLMDAAVRSTNQQVSKSTQILQDILTAAADERGEWEVPLRRDRLEALKQAMEKHAASLDESLLANAYAWMRKASDDKLDGMVALLQTVLQLYAARSLVAARPEKENDPGDEAVTALLRAEEGEWDALLASTIKRDNVREESFKAAMRRRMEATALGLPSGSYAQRVQAEYLTELEGRARAAFQNARTVQ